MERVLKTKRASSQGHVEVGRKPYRRFNIGRAGVGSCLCQVLILSGILHAYPGKVQQVFINPFKMKQHMPLLLYFGVMGVEDVRCSALTAEELPEAFPSLRLVQFPKAMP